MKLEAHLGQSISGQSATFPPSLLTPSTLAGGSFNLRGNVLGNAFIQTPAPPIDVDRVIEMYFAVLRDTSPSEKLAALKRQKFKEAGRQERIEASLAALNAPQPTALTLEQWKEVVEEIEEED